MAASLEVAPEEWRSARLAGVRVLLAADNLAARLTLAAVLEKSGYRVDSAASSAEAMEKLERGQYELVLCDLRGEEGGSCERVLRLARAQEYRPAAALFRASPEEPAEEIHGEVLVETVDVADLLTRISNLIAGRAYDRSERTLRRGWP